MYKGNWDLFEHNDEMDHAHTIYRYLIAYFLVNISEF